MSGFTLEYTKLILSALYSIGKKEPEYKTPNGSPWPIVAPGSVIIPTPKIASEFEFGLQSEKSQTATPDIYRVRQGNKTPTHTTPTSFDIDNVIHNDDAAINRGYPVAVGQNAVAAQPIPPLLVSISGSAPSIDTSDAREDRNSTPRLPSSVVLQLVPADIIPADIIPARPSTPEQGGLFSAQRQSSGSSNLLSSPNTMNKLNEQDPAFRRTMDALRHIESQNRGPTKLPALDSVLNVGSPQSGSSPAGHLNSNLEEPGLVIADQRKPSFMGRIKGMFSK